MTGWAQIKGCRGETPEIEHMVQRVNHDIWYVENRSVRLDLIIILKTPIALLNDAF
jgi:putative colanic acid biosynthesis UDP-glucose lipid carrier transferase